MAGLAVHLLLDLNDTVLTPWATSEALHGRAGYDDPLQVLTDGLAWLHLGAFVATRITFISWLYLARKNLDTWRIRGLRRGAGWAIRAWLLPLANLVMPAPVMNSVVRGSRTPVARSASQRIDRAAVKLRPLIAARWAHQVLVSGKAGAVDTEVEPGLGEAEIPIKAVGGRTRVPASLAIIGPITDRARATPGPIATTRTSRQHLLTHAGKSVTSTLR